jgi:tRNA threonylcarbamoyladenosine biosynthesis protein TsaE
MKKSFLINNLNDMNRLAELVSKTVKPGYIIGLQGTLGSGKTTFTQFLARHIGIKDNVNSPTFTILKVYKGEIPLYHMDVYRLENIGYDYELDDFIYGKGIAVIEWYTYIRAMLPDEMMEILIEVINETNRIVTIEGSGTYEFAIKSISDRYGN